MTGRYLRNRGPAVQLASVILAVVLAPSAFAATYHVAKTGNDTTGDGSAGNPWLTIGKGATTAVAGDTVIVHQGAYNEAVTPSNSGSAGSPITFVGERGDNGEWLTIVDPSSEVGTMTEDTSVGEGVYKISSSDKFVLHYDGQLICKLSSTVMANTGSKGGFAQLNYDVDAEVDCGDDESDSLGVDIKYWDTVHALYGVKDGYLYVRLKDRDDPNALSPKLRSAGSTAYGFNLSSRSYITVRDLHIRGAYIGVRLYGGGYNTLEQNYISCCPYRVYMGSQTEHNVIRLNRITYNLYGGHEFGAFDDGVRDGSAPYVYALRQYNYKLYHHVAGSVDFGVNVAGAGAGNEICNNEFYDGPIGGLYVAGAAGLDVYANRFCNFSSGAVAIYDGACNLQLHDNLFSNAAHNVRPQNLDVAGVRSIYIYRNRFYNPAYVSAGGTIRGVGNHFFFHFLTSGTSHSEDVRLYVYHNSFSGGYNAFSFNGNEYSRGGLPNAQFINNVCSSYNLFQGYMSGFLTTAGMVGLFDYNWVRTTPSGVTWYGAHNLGHSGAYLWGLMEEPNWLLPKGSDARENGLDLSSYVPIEGDPELPGLDAGYFGGTAPDIGAVQMTGQACDMKYRMKLTFDNSDSCEDLTDFPVLVKLNSSRINYSLLQADGDDIRFTDSDGTTPLAYEVELWDTSGDSSIWVKAPGIDRASTEDCIWMYYGDASAVNGQDTDAVWSNGYKGVWHLNTVGTGNRPDSTGNGNSAVPYNYEGDEHVTATARIGGADQLESAHLEYLRTSSSSSLSIPAYITWEMWFHPDTDGSTNPAILAEKNTCGGTGYRLACGSNNRLTWAINYYTAGGTLTTGNNMYTTGQWNYVVVTADTDALMTVDVFDGSGTQHTATKDPDAALANCVTALFMPGGSSSGTCLNGTADEMRISSVVRSAAWIKAQYLSMTDDFIIWGPVQPLSGYRRALVLNNSDLTAALTDVPVLIKLDSSRIAYAHAESDGSDVWFADASGNPFKHEIELWDTSGASSVWVQAPSVTTGDRPVVYMYYGDADIAPGQDADAVWSNGYRGVWHLNTEGETAVRPDATSYANNATPYYYTGDGDTEHAAAKIAYGDDLDGANDFLRVSDSDSLDVTTAVTVSAWFKPDTNDNDQLISKYSYSTSGGGFLLWCDSNNKVQWRINDADSGTTLTTDNAVVTAGAWNNVAATYNDAADAMAIYVNGELVKSGSAGGKHMTANAYALYIGGTTYYADGLFDEARVSNVTRSAEWIKFQYKTMSDSIVTYGDEEAR